jgi:hypothetical protein
MVIGELKVVKTTKVKNNPYYGSFEITDTYTHHIVNEQYIGLVSPQNGIHVVVKSIDGDKLDITVGKYAFTGECEKDYDEENTEFSTSFSFGGHIYEVTVDTRGQLISLDEWYGMGDFEDGNEPDNHYTKKDEYTKKNEDFKWDLIDM